MSTLSDTWNYTTDRVSNIDWNHFETKIQIEIDIPIELAKIPGILLLFVQALIWIVALMTLIVDFQHFALNFLMTQVKDWDFARKDDGGPKLCQILVVFGRGG